MGKVLFNVQEAVQQIPAFENKAEEVVKKNYLESKDKFMEDFESHPVTQEIQDGATASNSSNTLNGIGNLFSYIGFYASQAPVQELRDLLNKSFSFKKGRKSKNGSKFIITYPDMETIKKNTPMPWEGGRSWVSGIERGISGFGNYIYKTFASGRSGEGLQASNKVRGSSFKRVRYMSEMIKNFVNSINQ
jgi:hypothetical protein